MLRPHLCFRQSRSCLEPRLSYIVSLHFTSASYSLLFLVRRISLLSLLLHPLPLLHLPSFLTFFLSFPFFSSPSYAALCSYLSRIIDLKTKLQTFCATWVSKVLSRFCHSTFLPSVTTETCSALPALPIHYFSRKHKYNTNAHDYV